MPTDTVARALLHVVMLVMRTVAADMRRASEPLAPTQMSSLMRIAAGPCTMSDLARYLAVGLPTVSKSIDMLVRHGWVERWVDKSDRRQAIVRLTVSGQRILAEMTRRAERRIAGTLAPLTPAERAQLMAAMTSLSGALGKPGDVSCAAVTDGRELFREKRPARTPSQVRRQGLMKTNARKRANGAQQEGVR